MVKLEFSADNSSGYLIVSLNELDNTIARLEAIGYHVIRKYIF